MKPSLFWLSLLVTPLFSQDARATPTGNPLPGPTGLASIPTTETVAPGALEATLLYERVNFGESDGNAQLLPLVNATYGLGRGEIGAAYIRERTDIEGAKFNTDYFALHGKARLYEHNFMRVAAGAHYYDFGSSQGEDLGSVASVYAVASTGFGRALGDAKAGRVHGGVLLQRVSGGGGESDTGIRPFVGVEYAVASLLSLNADYLAKDGAFARAYSVALNYQDKITPLSGRIGFGRFNSDDRFFASLTYRFDLASKRDVAPSVALAPVILDEN